MAIISLALYGSRARKDEEADSDIDLFAITDDIDYKMIVNGSTNIANYPRELAFDRASHGDLFILHIVSESRALYDPDGELARLKAAFCFKRSYNVEMRHASDIAWMLIDLASGSDNYSFINKRIAWCVRTILIARAANDRKAIFSAKGLADFSGFKATLDLIKGKGVSRLRKKSLDELKIFLGKFGFSRPIDKEDLSLRDYGEIFYSTENVMGKKTMTVLQGSAEDFYT